MKKVRRSEVVKTRVYRKGLRAQQTEETRERIVTAAYELLRTTRPVDLSFAGVAVQAEVSLRTVYRHFPTAHDLFMGVSDAVFANHLPAGASEPRTLEELIGALKIEFSSLESDPARFRLMFAVPSRSRMDQSAVFTRLFDPYLPKLTKADRKTVFAIIDLLGSPYCWDVMHHNWDIRTERSIRAVLVTVQALVQYLIRHPKALSPNSPAPVLAPKGKKR